jgi:F-type H+-transporting ATPase subunit delta
VSNFEDVARPYATAAFEFAKAHQTVTHWGTMLAMLSAIVQDEKVQQALHSPRYNSQQQAELLMHLSGDALDTHGHNFLRVLAENRRLLALPQISRQYLLLQEQDAHEMEVSVTTARPLSISLQQQLIAALEKKLKVKVQLHQHTDPTLLGGAKLHVGDEVTDVSLLGRLQRLASHLHLKENL